jgi:hypothetical protein
MVKMRKTKKILGIETAIKIVLFTLSPPCIATLPETPLIEPPGRC